MGEKKPKAGGGKLARSETVTVRLDPKLRYLAEIAARIHRRTLSSYIEWALEESLTQVNISEESGDSGDDYHRAISVIAAADSLWDVDEADRIAKIAFQFPELLTHGEQVLWKLIRENGLMWNGRFDDQGNWVWKVEPSHLIYPRIRDYLELFKSVADGTVNRNALPQWRQHGDPNTPMTGVTESKPNDSHNNGQEMLK